MLNHEMTCIQNERESSLAPCKEAARLGVFSSSYKKFIMKTENYISFNFTVKYAQLGDTSYFLVVF